MVLAALLEDDERNSDQARRPLQLRSKALVAELWTKQSGPFRLENGAQLTPSSCSSEDPVLERHRRLDLLKQNSHRHKISKELPWDWADLECQLKWNKLRRARAQHWKVKPQAVEERALLDFPAGAPELEELRLPQLPFPEHASRAHSQPETRGGLSALRVQEPLEDRGRAPWPAISSPRTIYESPRSRPRLRPSELRSAWSTGQAILSAQEDDVDMPLPGRKEAEQPSVLRPLPVPRLLEPLSTSAVAGVEPLDLSWMPSNLQPERSLPALCQKTLLSPSVERTEVSSPKPVVAAEAPAHKVWSEEVGAEQISPSLTAKAEEAASSQARVQPGQSGGEPEEAAALVQHDGQPARTALEQEVSEQGESLDLSPLDWDCEALQLDLSLDFLEGDERLATRGA